MTWNISHNILLISVKVNGFNIISKAEKDGEGDGEGGDKGDNGVCDDDDNNVDEMDVEVDDDDDDNDDVDDNIIWLLIKVIKWINSDDIISSGLYENINNVYGTSVIHWDNKLIDVWSVHCKSSNTNTNGVFFVAKDENNCTINIFIRFIASRVGTEDDILYFIVLPNKSINTGKDSINTFIFGPTDVNNFSFHAYKCEDDAVNKSFNTLFITCLILSNGDRCIWSLLDMANHAWIEVDEEEEEEEEEEEDNWLDWCNIFCLNCSIIIDFPKPPWPDNKHTFDWSFLYIFSYDVYNCNNICSLPYNILGNTNLFVISCVARGKIGIS